MTPGGIRAAILNGVYGNGEIRHYSLISRMNSDVNVGRVVLLALSAVGHVSLVGRVSLVGGIFFKSKPLREQRTYPVCNFKKDTQRSRSIVTFMLV